MARKQPAKRPSPPKKSVEKNTPAKSRPDKALSRPAFKLLPDGYGELLDDLKTRVRAAQIKAVVAANRELIQL